MRVLRISHTASFPSYRERERALVRQGIDLHVVTARDWPHLGRENDRTEKALHVREASILGAGNVPLFAFDPIAIARELQSFRPEIVDIHEEAYSVSGFQSAVLAQQFAPKAKLLFYTAQNIFKRYPPPFCWTERFVYSKSSAAYPCSTAASDVLKAKGYGGIRRVIPLGVDTKSFRPDGISPQDSHIERERRELNGFVIGYFGRIESYKGIEVLLRSAALMRNLPMMVSLLIVGTGHDAPRFQSLAKDLGLHTVWLGEAHAAEVPRLMRLCDAISVPSLTTDRWKEQFGRVVVEAMASGVPVVTSDSGSLMEVSQNCALHSPEGDAEKHAAQLIRVARDPGLVENLTSHGLALVQERYSWDKVAEQMIHLYRDIL